MYVVEVGSIAGKEPFSQIDASDRLGGERQPCGVEQRDTHLAMRWIQPLRPPCGVVYRQSFRVTEYVVPVHSELREDHFASPQFWQLIPGLITAYRGHLRPGDSAPGLLLAPADVAVGARARLPLQPVLLVEEDPCIDIAASEHIAMQATKAAHEGLLMFLFNIEALELLWFSGTEEGADPNLCAVAFGQ